MNWSSKWDEDKDTGSGSLPMDGSVGWGSKNIKPQDIKNLDWNTSPAEPGKLQTKQEWVVPTLNVKEVTEYKTDGSINQFRQLTVKEGHKNYTFKAEIIGDLALDYDAVDGWNIYHVPTLTLFSNAVPDHYPLNDRGSPQYVESFEYDKEPLLNWMAKVQKNYPTSWQMLRLLTPDNYNDKGQAAKDIIKQWCLSVPVVS